MPRTEKPLDPSDGPVEAFAHDLRALREKAGLPPYRTLAKRAGYSASALSIAASGTVLPSLVVTLAYVQSCGGDPEPWRERWQVLAARPLEAPAEYEVRHTPRSVPTAVIVASGTVPATAGLRDRYDARRLWPVLVIGTVLLIVLSATAAAANRPVMPRDTSRPRCGSSTA